MTSKVTVTAHCGSNKQVLVEVTGEPEKLLRDGESVEVYAYDDRVISVREEMKEAGE